MFVRSAVCALVAVCALSATAVAAEWGLKEGKPDLQSAGPLAFGPDGILLVGDVKAATLYAIDTGEGSGDPEKVQVYVEKLNEKVAETVGGSPAEVTINDLAVNPQSGSIYLSVSKGTEPALLRLDQGGKLSAFSLEKVPFAKVELPNAPEDKEVGEGNRRRNLRNESITDLAFVDGKVLVSGTSSAAAPATLREVPFPFETASAGTSIEIFHGAHGRLEDNATPRVFVPFNIGGEPSLLAGFTCTPLVKFPIASLESGKTVRGTTVAELGNRNRPLDMIVYEKGGQSYLLMANSARGVMKISTNDLERDKGITEPVSGGGVAGQTYETIEDLKGIVQLDKLDASRGVVLAQTDTGAQTLQIIDLP